MAFSTKVDLSRQIKQLSNTTAVLSGSTSILEKLYVNGVEFDLAGAPSIPDGYVLAYDATLQKFVPVQPVSVSNPDNEVLSGMRVTNTPGNALSFDIDSGSYKIGSNIYIFNGGTIVVPTGDSANSRYDIIYIDSTVTLQSVQGTPAASPVPPTVSTSQLPLSLVLISSGLTSGGTAPTPTSPATTVYAYNQTSGAINAIERADGNSVATGDYSSALGYGTIAAGNYQNVVGKYNVSNGSALFIVGGGSSDLSRKNVLVVDSSGSLYLNSIKIDITGSTTDGYALAYDTATTSYKPKALVSDLAYNETSWNGVTNISPSQNALRDKFVEIENTFLAGKVATTGDTMTGLLNYSSTGLTSGASATTLMTKQYIDSVSDYLENLIDTQSITLSNDINNVAIQLPDKADLVGGLVPLYQLPALSFGNTFVIDEVSGLTASTSVTTAATTGDIAVITGTNQTYILGDVPYSAITNWVELLTPAAVVSVAGKSGVVTLIPSDIVGLETQLNSKLPLTGGTVTGNTYINGNFTADTIFSGSSNINTLFAPTVHTHVISAITGLQTALDSKVEISGFTAYTASTLIDINNKVNRSGDTLTGVLNYSGISVSAFSANTLVTKDFVENNLDYLKLSGGTVSGNTSFTANLSANTLYVTNIGLYTSGATSGQYLVYNSATTRFEPTTTSLDISGKVDKTGDTLTGLLNYSSTGLTSGASATTLITKGFLEDFHFRMKNFKSNNFWLDFPAASAQWNGVHAISQTTDVGVFTATNNYIPFNNRTITTTTAGSWQFRPNSGNSYRYYMRRNDYANSMKGQYFECNIGMGLGAASWTAATSGTNVQVGVCRTDSIVFDSIDNAVGFTMTAIYFKFDTDGKIKFCQTYSSGRDRIDTGVTYKKGADANNYGYKLWFYMPNDESYLQWGVIDLYDDTETTGITTNGFPSEAVGTSTTYRVGFPFWYSPLIALGDSVHVGDQYWKVGLTE